MPLFVIQVFWRGRLGFLSPLAYFLPLLLRVHSHLSIFFVFVSARPRETKAEEALETAQGQEGWPLCPFFVSFPFGFRLYSAVVFFFPLVLPPSRSAYSNSGIWMQPGGQVPLLLLIFFFFFSPLARVVCRRKAAEIYKKSGLDFYCL
ncbi:hypothetical protein IWX91DRAFT_60142 [Phyllosticta citricarpa]